jgi:hypothetical protein
MDKKEISVSHNMKGVLDNDYTLYDEGIEELDDLDYIIKKPSY